MNPKQLEKMIEELKDFKEKQLRGALAEHAQEIIEILESEKITEPAIPDRP